MSAELLGREQLVQNLSKLREDILRKVVVQTEIVQAKVVNFAKSNHPYQDRTGNLTNSIQPGRIVVQDVRVEAEVAARMSYAGFVEHGTSRMRPYPFMFPAIAAHTAEFRQRIGAAVGEAKP